MKDNCPLVSISCITFNHAPYIRQCLDGFMMQQTNFPFEVLIHDDASTDGTTEIIKEYEAKYPDIIKPLYEEENQWVKGRRGSAVFNFPRAKGKYIALCEGDDYWTDSLKLQKQVDVLNEYNTISICGHNAFDFNMTENKISLVNNTIDDALYSIEDIIERDWFIPTNSLMFRRDIFLKRYRDIKIVNGDYYVLLLLLAGGENLYYSRDVMSVYRRHSGGISNKFNCAILERNLNVVLDEINRLTDGAYYSSIIKKKKRLASLTLWERKTHESLLYKLAFALISILNNLYTKLYYHYYNARHFERNVE